MRLIHIIASGSMGGKERYALDICTHFASAGHDVIALTRDAKAIDEPFARAGVSLRHAPLRDYPDFFSSVILSKMLKESPVGDTIIHVHRYRDALTAIAARRLAGRPDVRIIASRHKSDPGKDNWLRRYIYRRIDAHIFVSEFSMRRFLSSWPEGRYPFDSRRLHVALNSRRVMPDRVPEPERGAVTAMYHGVLRQGKGLETIIRALHIIKGKGKVKVRLRIVGSGDSDFTDSLRSLATRCGVMDLIDWMRTTDDPAQLIATCHFGVLPSETPEAFGMANIEYMMAGRPQITTFNGAQGEYLTPGVEALAVEPGDAEGLAEAMSRLTSDGSLRREMGEAAAQNYDRLLAWPSYIATISDIYRRTSSL